MRQSGQQLFTSNEKVWKAGMTHLVICSGYNADVNHYYMTSDNVFSDWLTSLVTFFDK
jgi:hypothetical protein